MISRYPCPCCGFLTLFEEPPGTWLICKVCFWEDDSVQYRNLDFAGGANKESLNQARKNFLELGASSENVLKYVRKPLKEEIPPD